MKKRKLIAFIGIILSFSIYGFYLYTANQKAIAASNTEISLSYEYKLTAIDTLRDDFPLNDDNLKDYNIVKKEVLNSIDQNIFTDCDSLLENMFNIIKQSSQKYFSPIINDFEFYFKRTFNDYPSSTLNTLTNLKEKFYLACDKLNLSLAEKYALETKNFIIKNNKIALQNKYKGIDLCNPHELSEPIYVDNILLVNKDYALPSSYNPGNKNIALKAFNEMKMAARKEGIYIEIGSSFRSFNYQVNLFNRYASIHGQEKANTFSAKPGHSEHQSGLTFDIVGTNSNAQINENFDNTIEAKWLKENAHKYGFILRFPENKSHITGYKYESWHYRYIGKEHSKHFANNNLTLEEYLGLA